MESVRRCRSCGGPLGQTGGRWLCPGCLLEVGLSDSQADEPSSGTTGGRPIDSGVTAGDSGVGSPRTLGGYELEEEIARGGMGIVYRARQPSLDRRVAVKVLLFGPHAHADMIRRFKAEATAAGALHHPNIVAIHEVGMEAGRHYLVMDLVDGPNLGDLAQGRPLPSRQAAGYLETIAEAIHFAHEHGVLHRDLKPSNVLVDAQGRPRVTDFGLARRLDGDSSLTVTGQVLGTPNYMPPEQVTTTRSRVTRRGDVYGLGAVLYHLLTGRPPFQGESWEATLHQVLTAEPPSPRLLNAAVPRDLETLCLKCLEKEPGRRFATARELADELARFRRGEPILSRPVSWPERAWRWCRRKPAVASLVILVHLVAGVGLAGILSQWRRAERNATEARRQSELAEGRSYAGQMRLAHSEYREGQPGSARQRLEFWIPGPGRPDPRGFEWRWLHRLCASSPGEVLAARAGGYTAVAASPDGGTVALGTGDGAIQLVAERTGAADKTWSAHPGAVDGLEFVPGAPHWLASVGGDDERLKIWDTREGRLLASTNASKGMLAHVAVSRSGRYLATGAYGQGGVDVWELARDPESGRPRLSWKRRCEGRGPSAFSPDERTIAVANYWDFRLALWDLRTGQLLGSPKPEPAGYMATVAFSPDGRWIGTCAGLRQVVLWPADHPTGPGRTFQANAEVQVLRFSADSQGILAATLDENLLAWDLNVPDRPAVLSGHGNVVRGLAFLPNAPEVISASLDGTARRWRVDVRLAEAAVRGPAEFEVLKPVTAGNTAALGMAVSPDQRRLAVSFVYEAWVFDLLDGRVESKVASATALGIPGAAIYSVAYSPDGCWLAFGSEGGRVALVDARTLRPVREPFQVLDRSVTSLDFALGGRVLIVGFDFHGELALVDSESGRIRQRLPSAGNLPREARAVSSDGARLVMASADHHPIVYEIESGRPLAKYARTVRFLGSVAFSPDDRWVAFGDQEGSIHLWDPTGRRAGRRWTGHRGSVLGLAFSPDGRTLASGGMDHTIRLWHTDSDQEVAILTGHTSVVFNLAFALHGDALASVGLNSASVLVWRAAPEDSIRRR